MNATLVLAGNPNSGKTTLFNELTGGRQRVGNYPGVTVEKKQGTCKGAFGQFTIVDLPGTYSLTAYSLEEVVTRNFLVDENPSMVVNIVDATNLERHLYLTVQFMEMGLPVCIALNMMDLARKKGIVIDVQKLSALLNVPVVPMVARDGKGKQALMEIIATLPPGEPIPLRISYGLDLDAALDEMAQMIRDSGFPVPHYDPRWLAVKYLEQDGPIMDKVAEWNRDLALALEERARKVAGHVAATLNTRPEGLIADHRHGYVHSVLKRGVITEHRDKNRMEVSDTIDQILTHRFLGPMIMVAMLMGLYQFTFSLSAVPVSRLEGFFGWISSLADQTLPDGLLKSLAISGIIDGVGGVLGFVPLILFMFFGIAFLEDSGYLARMSFMLDKIFRIFGLHGNSVMAFIVSGGIAGGCAVPGVMAARTLKSPKERLATLLTVPFMNCGAKLPVFALLTAAFFAENQAGIMLIITLISWTGALLTARLLRSTIIRGESTPFVMELPPYRMPTLKGLVIHTFERVIQYIQKAGTVILLISIVLWAMMTFPGLDDHRIREFEDRRAAIAGPIGIEDLKRLDQEISDSAGKALDPERMKIREDLLQVDRDQAQEALKSSLAGRIGTEVEAVTRFAGLDWRTNIALIGGLAAKEVVVSTLGTAHSLGEIDPEDTTSLSDRLASAEGWGPLTAFSLMLFTIFYSPCFVTVVCVARETGTWKWAAFSVVFNTTLALAVSTCFYQIGRMVVA